MAFPGYSTNKTDRHDIAELLLKVALKTKNLPKQQIKQPENLIWILGQKHNNLSTFSMNDNKQNPKRQDQHLDIRN